jgi:hypothetical protein
MEQRQEFFKWMLSDLLGVVVSRRAAIDRKMPANVEIQITGADISSRDNSTLALASNYMVNVLSELRDRQLITNAEMVRLIYRFMGETVDIDELLKKAAGEAGPQGTLPKDIGKGDPRSDPQERGAEMPDRRRKEHAAGSGTTN